LTAVAISWRDKRSGVVEGFTALGVGTLAVRNRFTLDGVAEELVELWELSESRLGGRVSSLQWRAW
jgi:hypothetical protein